VAVGRDKDRETVRDQGASTWADVQMNEQNLRRKRIHPRKQIEREANERLIAATTERRGSARLELKERKGTLKGFSVQLGTRRGSRCWERKRREWVHGGGRAFVEKKGKSVEAEGAKSRDPKKSRSLKESQHERKGFEDEMEAKIGRRRRGGHEKGLPQFDALFPLISQIQTK
jgi:hypothetical protein